MWHISIYPVQLQYPLWAAVSKYEPPVIALTHFRNYRGGNIGKFASVQKPLARTRHTHLPSVDSLSAPRHATKFMWHAMHQESTLYIHNVWLLRKWALQEALEMEQKFQNCGPRSSLYYHLQWTLFELRPVWRTNNLGYEQNFSFDLRPECQSRPKRVSACAVVNKDPRCVRKRQSEPRYACLWT
jgi:hypothetical protein